MMYGSLQHDFSGRKRRKSKVKGEVYGKFKKPAFEQHAVPIVKTYAMVRLEEAHRIPSNTDFSTARPESTAKPERKEYTGTLVKGISTLHKSNAVPIISQDDALEHARMRR
jgi:hypothetical protein